VVGGAECAEGGADDDEATAECGRWGAHAGDGDWGGARAGGDEDEREDDDHDLAGEQRQSVASFGHEYACVRRWEVGCVEFAGRFEY